MALLTDILSELPDTVVLEIRRNLSFMHDGVPAYSQLHRQNSPGDGPVSS
jgi:hypothetical protein